MAYKIGHVVALYDPSKSVVDYFEIIDETEKYFILTHSKGNSEFEADAGWKDENDNEGLIAFEKETFNANIVEIDDQEDDDF